MSTQMELNRNLAQMLKGGVIMDVTTPEQAKIAEEAGACAVMALERIPADIRAAGGVSRMSDPKMIKGIQDAVSIPVMAKCRIGHFAEARILQAIKIDYIDESEVLSPADDKYHINKNDFKVPFVCGAKDLGEALRRINEGAAMIRTKGEPGTGDVVQAVRHMRMMMSEIRRIQNMSEDELYEAAKQLQVPYNLVEYVHENGKLPVVNFAAGGVVIEGNRLGGTTLGFPTANINIDESMILPPNGVYITKTLWRGAWYPSITNVGNKPTIGEYAKNMETHILDTEFNRDLYGEILRVEFLKKLRDEKKFDSLDALRDEIARNCDVARAYHLQTK